MRPVLFHVGGVPVQSYGVSKALAALVAGWLIYRELMRRGARKEPAYQLASQLTLWRGRRVRWREALLPRRAPRLVQH